MNETTTADLVVPIKLPRYSGRECCRLRYWRCSRLKDYFGAVDQIFPIFENWPTKCNVALLSKLPTNYTKIPEKIHFTYHLRKFFIFFVSFLCNVWWP